MYHIDHSVNFKHMTLNCYDNQNDEQNVNTCKTLALKLSLGNACKDLFPE